MDVRDRFLRALSGLEETRVAADAGTRTVLGGFQDHVRSLYADFHRTVVEHLEGVRAAFGDDPIRWPQEELHSLSASAVRGFDSLGAAHDDFCAHLPGVARARDDLRYLLIRSLGFSLMNRSHTRLLSVQQSSVLTWEASRFSKLQPNSPVAAAIAVPWLETLSPLRWPLAVHEVGHYFLPGEAAEQVAPRIEEIAATEGWREHDYASFKEIVADAVAQRAFGDAFALAFAREGYLLSYSTHLEGGVSVKSRLELLGGPDDLIANLPLAWMMGSDRPANPAHAPQGGSKTPTGGTPPETPHETSPEACRRMREVAVDLVGTLTPNDPRAVVAARELIRAGEPPGAVLLHGQDELDPLNRLAQSINDATPPPTQDIAAITSLAVHRRLSDGEILEAAWREDYERDVSGFMNHFQGTTIDKEALDRAMREVTQADTWLSRALQSAAVHRWLQDSEELAGHA